MFELEKGRRQLEEALSRLPHKDIDDDDIFVTTNWWLPADISSSVVSFLAKKYRVPKKLVVCEMIACGLRAFEEFFDEEGWESLTEGLDEKKVLDINYQHYVRNVAMLRVEWYHMKLGESCYSSRKRSMVYMYKWTVDRISYICEDYFLTYSSFVAACYTLSLLFLGDSALRRELEQEINGLRKHYEEAREYYAWFKV